jgi:hypothetical protein
MTLMSGSKSQSRTTLGYVALSLWIVLVIVMAYGTYRFPAAPFRLVDGQYIDKRGQTHSREDFERLRTWEGIYITSWVAAAAAGIASLVQSRREGRR